MKSIKKIRKAWKLHQNLYKVKGAFADVHKTTFFKGHTPIEDANTSKPKPIIQSKDRMYIVDSGASLRMMVRKFFLSTGKKNHTTETTHHREIQTSSAIVRSTKRGEGLHPEARHLLVREVGGRLASRIAAADPSAPASYTDSQQQQQQQQGSRFFNLLLPIWQEEIPGESRLGTRGGATTASGRLGHRGAKTNGARHVLLTRGELATKDRILPVTDGCCKHCTVHNVTFPAFAHSSTREHEFPCLAQDQSKQGSSLCLNKVICSHSDLHTSPCMDTFIYYTDTVNTDTTLDIDDTQATASDCNNPSEHSRFRSMFGFFAERASLTRRPWSQKNHVTTIGCAVIVATEDVAGTD